jgi:hypothetical protein
MNNNKVCILDYKVEAVFADEVNQTLETDIKYNLINKSVLDAIRNFNITIDNVIKSY